MKKNILQRNYVNIKGHGKQTMVFAPGFGCDQRMWRLVTPAFIEDYRIILFDYVGAGRSDVQAYDAEKYGDLNGYAQDLIEILETLDISHSVFVGHSVGCTIGLLAAISRPELFSKLVMIGPSPRYLNDLPNYCGGFELETLEGFFEMMEKNYIGWANYSASIIMQNANRPELAGELEESFCSTDPIIASNFARATFFADNRADLALAPVPSLILQCKDDAIAPGSVGEYVNHHMPQSTLKYMQATGHCPHLSHPEETIQLITDYLRREKIGNDLLIS